MSASAATSTDPASGQGAAPDKAWLSNNVFADSAGEGASPECKRLLDAATKDIFRKNAFRITGLPVDATARDVAKHSGNLKMLAELGQNPHVQSGYFSLKPAPTLDEIREAIEKFKEPEERMVDEFFWFWPEEFGKSQSDPAIEAVRTGDSNTAIKIWAARENEEGPSIVAKHNRALAYHIRALDWENYCIKNEVDAERRQKIGNYWKEALNRWQRLATDDRLWKIVTARIRQLNEPNLTTGFARRMRATLAAALDKINTELAVAFAESGKIEFARLHIQLMRETNRRPNNAEQTFGLVLTPVRKRLKEQVRQAKERGDRNPEDSVSAARDLLEQTRDKLALFDLFFGKDSDLRNDVFDEVAGLCNQLQVTYHKATAINNNDACLELLETVLPLATSPELRTRIEENIKTLIENIEAVKKNKFLYGNLKPISSAPSLRTMNGVGCTLYGSTDRDAETGSYLATYYFVFLWIPIFPICRYRVTNHGNSYRFFGKAPLRPGDKWHLAISLGLILSAMIALFSNNSSSSSSSSSVPYSAPLAYNTSRSSSAPSSSSGFGKGFTKSEEQLEREAAERNARMDKLINSLGVTSSPSYTSSRSSSYSSPSSRSSNSIAPNSGPDSVYRAPSLVSSALDREKAAIESERRTLETLETQSDTLGPQIESERLYLNQTNPYAVQQFNAKVNRYNALIQQNKTATAAFNAKVDGYNAKLRQYGH